MERDYIGGSGFQFVSQALNIFRSDSLQVGFPALEPLCSSTGGGMYLYASAEESALPQVGPKLHISQSVHAEQHDLSTTSSPSHPPNQCPFKCVLPPSGCVPPSVVPAGLGGHAPGPHLCRVPPRPVLRAAVPRPAVRQPAPRDRMRRLGHLCGESRDGLTMMNHPHS